ncbi:MAG: LysR family transcriptional regulator [Cyanobacteria bacterium P01_G01_bin.4]
MRLEQLQAFLAVSESGSFQQAARHCNITQSTVSRQIQSLETQLGLSLFHRSTPAKLTVAGEHLLARARRICQEWESATLELAELAAGKQTELCIAAIQSACSTYLPPILQQFCSDYPGVQLRVTSLGSDRALKVLRDGLVDVAIVMHNRWLTEKAETKILQLYDEPIDVLLAANHPLAERSSVPWPELAKYPQVVFKDGYGMQRLVQEQFQRQGLELKAALELNTLDAFRGIVKQGNMVALLPQAATLTAIADPQLVTRPTDPPRLSRQVALVTTQDRLEFPPIRHFCQLVQQHQSSFGVNRSATVAAETGG